MMVRRMRLDDFSEDLIGVVNNHIAHTPRACDENSGIEPSISLIASLESEMEAHSECIRADLALSQLFQNFFLACSCSVASKRQYAVFAWCSCKLKRIALLTLLCASK